MNTEARSYNQAMQPDDAMPIALSPTERTGIQRLVALLGHHDVRIYVRDGCYLDIGRGSIEAALHLDMAPEDFTGCIGTVGQMCNFAWNCSLHGGGEHHNGLPVNIVFSGITAFARESASNATLRPWQKRPFHIGNAVVVSSGARVLPGCSIGDGAVLGANSVSSGSLQPFGIYGGVPARLIRPRFDEATQGAVAAVRWWDFELDYLRAHLADLQAVAIDRAAGHRYRRPQPGLVMALRKRGGNYDIEIRGFVQDGIERPLSQAPERARAYLAQLAGEDPCYWLADMWNATASTP